jgi:transcriptional regulator with XRE-family HTH domain
MCSHPLRAYRQREGKTLGQLADELGTSAASLSRIETGKQAPSWPLVARVQELTKGEVRPDDFLPSAACS